MTCDNPRVIPTMMAAIKVMVRPIHEMRSTNFFLSFSGGITKSSSSGSGSLSPFINIPHWKECHFSRAFGWSLWSYFVFFLSGITVFWKKRFKNDHSVSNTSRILVLSNEVYKTQNRVSHQGCHLLVYLQLPQGHP